MNDLIRTTLYTGVGTLVLAKSKFMELVEELIQNNELTKEEGQRVILAVIHKMEDQKISIETKFLGAIDQFLKKMNLPLRTELEIRFSEILTDLKNNNLTELLKKPADKSPATR